MKKYLLLFVLLFIKYHSFAQNEEIEFTLASPHNTIYNHLFYLQTKTYDLDKSSKTIYGLDDKTAKTTAVQIKQVLDAKNLYVTVSTLPLDSFYVDSQGVEKYILFPNVLPEVSVEKINGKWYYSAETIEVISIIHKDIYPYGSNVLLNLLPKMGTGKFLGIMVWQYIGFLIFVAIGILLYMILIKLLDLILTSITKTRFGEIYSAKNIIHPIAKYTCLIVVLNLFSLFLPVLQIPISITLWLSLVIDIFKYTFFILLGLRLFDFVMLFLNKAVDTTETKMDNQLLLIFRKGVQIAIITFGVITILNRLDINVTALIAGVSIGGLAIALAAQDSVKNLIGAFMIFVDKPFDVDDFIIAGSVQGVVKEVGFRSTKLQAADTSIIIVPNGKIADEVINNLGRRVYRRYRTQLGIKYNTPPDLIEIFITGVRKIIEIHPETLNEKTQVHLNEFNASSLDILMQTFFTVDTWDKELQGKEVLMMHILKLASVLNIEFAFPSQSLYIEKDENKASSNMQDMNLKLNDFIDTYKKEILQ